MRPGQEAPDDHVNACGDPTNCYRFNEAGARSPG